MRPQTAFKRQSMSEGPIEVAESVTVPHVETAPAEKKKRMQEICDEGHYGEEKGKFLINKAHGNWQYVEDASHYAAGIEDDQGLKETGQVEKGTLDDQILEWIQT